MFPPLPLEAFFALSLILQDVAEQVLGLAKNKSMTGVNIVMDAGYTV